MDMGTDKCVIFGIWKLPAWIKSFIITHLPEDNWYTLCYKVKSFKHYFTNNGCVITACGAGDSPIFTQKFSDGKYNFYFITEQPAISLILM